VHATRRSFSGGLHLSLSVLTFILCPLYLFGVPLNHTFLGLVKSILNEFFSKLTQRFTLVYFIDLSYSN
jgi:hypothetical protein